MAEAENRAATIRVRCCVRSRLIVGLDMRRTVTEIRFTPRRIFDLTGAALF